MVSPLHTSNADELTVGIGALLTLTAVAEDVAEQPFTSVNVTVYEPEVVTVIAADVAELDHTFPVA
jgi:hypothetical protein